MAQKYELLEGKNYYSFQGNPGCKGICKGFPEYKGTQSLKARWLFSFYLIGGKRCDRCQCLFRYDLMKKPTISRTTGRKIKGTYHFCPCCGFRLANCPATQKSKRRYNEFKALQRIE